MDKTSSLIDEKPFLTFEEQIDRLKDVYGLIVDNITDAKVFLSTISYYDLINGYKDCFMKNDKYTNDITIEDLFYFHTFDKSMQSTLFKYSVYVENRFKTLLAYVLGKSYGTKMCDYLEISKYKNARKTLQLLTSLKDIPHSPTVLNPTKHYVKKKREIPPWILLKNVTFNDAIDLFLSLEEDKRHEVIDLLFGNDVSNNYKESFAKNSLIIVRKFRNKIAHNLKFITYRTGDIKNVNSGNQIMLKNLSSTFGGSLIEKEDFQVKRGMNDPYAMILCIVCLLHEPIFISRFYFDVLNNIDVMYNYQYTEGIFEKYCEITNIPPNIRSRFEHHSKTF